MSDYATEEELAYEEQGVITSSGIAPKHGVEFQQGEGIQQEEESLCEELFLPSAHPHMTFKEFASEKADMSSAVVPAAVLAGYTGTKTLQFSPFCIFSHIHTLFTFENFINL